MLDRLLQTEMRARGLEYTVIGGEQIGSGIRSGAFLDFSGTIVFKASQIQAIARRETLMHSLPTDFKGSNYLFIGTTNDLAIMAPR